MRVWLEPTAPTIATLDPRRHPLALACLLVAFAVAFSACDSLAEGRWSHSVHRSCGRRPQRSGPGLEHRLAFFEPLWFGPRSSWVVLLLFLLAGVAFFKGSATPLTLALALGAALLLAIYLVRLAWEWGQGWRWRHAELVLEPPQGFVPGRAYRATLRGPGGPIRYRLERREEERFLPFNCDESDSQPPGWFADQVDPYPLAGVERSRGQTTLRFELPPDATLPRRERGELRERWVILARQLGFEVLFELDFAPVEPPLPPLEPLEAPNLAATRALVREAQAAGRLARYGSPPEWVRTTSPLALICRDQGTLLGCGRVVWARFVQANYHVFRPGDGAHAGMVVYAADGSLGPETLTQIANGLYESKAAPVDRLSQIIADEYERFLRYPVPEWLTPQPEVYAACVVILREHLPRGYLRERLVPLLVAPELTPAVLLLPAEWWADDLLAWGQDDEGFEEPGEFEEFEEPEVPA